MPKINAVYLYAGDLDRSIAFYRDLLGIPLERHATDPHWAEAHLEGGIRFALHASGQRLRPQVPGTVRVNFEDADLERTVERLRAAGTRCGPIEREDWGDSVEIFDPDGYAIELYRPPSLQLPAAG
jgi:catechol 2,3-dioxygenase-like lactoylglutathione lyase family enzyme